MRWSGNCPHLELRRAGSALCMEERAGGLWRAVWGGCPCWCGEQLWLCVVMMSHRWQVSVMSPHMRWSIPLLDLAWEQHHMQGGNGMWKPGGQPNLSKGHLNLVLHEFTPKMCMASFYRASTCKNGPHCVEDFPPPVTAEWFNENNMETWRLMQNMSILTGVDKRMLWGEPFALG